MPDEPEAPKPVFTSRREVAADVGRAISTAEAEIKALAQQLHDKIIAIGGDNWVTDLSADLREARNSVEAAAEWIKSHFEKQGGN